MVTEQNERIEQQVIKIHCIRLAAALLITLIYLAHHRDALELVMLVNIGVLDICGRCHKPVLCVRYTVLDHVGLVCLVVQLHIPDNGFYQILAVGLVVYGKVG